MPIHGKLFSFLKNLWDRLVSLLQSLWDNVIMPILEFIASLLGIVDEDLYLTQLSTQRLIPEEQKSGLVIALFRAIFESGDIANEIKLAVLAGPASSLRRYLRYGKTSYYYGLPTAKIASKQSSTIEIKDVLEGIYPGNTVQIIATGYGLIGEEYWIKDFLQTNENYVESSNIIVKGGVNWFYDYAVVDAVTGSFTIYLRRLDLIELKTVTSSASIFISTNPAIISTAVVGVTTANPVILIIKTFPASFPVNTFVTTTLGYLIPAIPSTEVHYTAVFTLNNITTARIYWVYNPSDGTYPELDPPVSQDNDPTSLLPIVPLREDFTFVNELDTAAMAAAQDPSIPIYLDPAYETSKKIMDLVGIKIDDMIQSVNEAPDNGVDDISDVYLVFGISIYTQSQGGLRSLYELFDSLEFHCDVTEEIYNTATGSFYEPANCNLRDQVWEGYNNFASTDFFAIDDGDFIKFGTNPTIYTITLKLNGVFTISPLIQEFGISAGTPIYVSRAKERPFNNFSITEGAYNLTLVFNWIRSTDVAGIIGTGKVGFCESEITVLPVDVDTMEERSWMEIRYQYSTTRHYVLRIQGLYMVTTILSTVGAGIISVVKLVDKNTTGTEEEIKLDDALRRNFIIPLSSLMLDNVNIYTDKEALIYESFHIVIYASLFIHLEWYETAKFFAFFTFVMQIVSILIFIYSFGTASTLSAFLWAIAKQLLINYGLTLLLTELLKIAGDDENLRVIAYLIYGIASYYAGGGWDSGMSTAENILNVVRVTIKVYETSLITEDTEDTSYAELARLEGLQTKLEEAEENFDTSATPNFYQLITETVIDGTMTPEKFGKIHRDMAYNNPGVMLLDEPRNYVANALSLENLENIEKIDQIGDIVDESSTKEK